MKNLLIIALMVFIGFSANAQGLNRKDATVATKTTEKLSPTERANQLTNRMQTQLDLSKKQHKSVYKINLTTATEIEQVRNSRMSQEMKRERIKQINDKRDSQFKSVLGAEQFERYYVAKTKRINARPAKGAKVERLSKELNLSPSQSEQVKVINQRHNKAVKALKDAGTVTKSELRTIKDSKRAQVKEILTPEQAKRYDEIEHQKQEMRQNPVARAERTTSYLTQKLNLTPAQTDKVRVINQKAAEAKQRLKAGNEINVEATKRALKSIEMERTQSLGKILSAEQMQQYKLFKAERKVQNQNAQPKREMPRPH